MFPRVGGEEAAGGVELPADPAAGAADRVPSPGHAGPQQRGGAGAQHDEPARRPGIPVEPPDQASREYCDVIVYDVIIVCVICPPRESHVEDKINSH